VKSSFGRFQLAIELVTIIFEEIDASILALAHDTLMATGWKPI